MPSRRTVVHALLGALVATPITLLASAGLHRAEASEAQAQTRARARFYTLPLKDDIGFILIAVDMPLLLLPWLEAVDITEESYRLKYVVLLHLVIAKLLIVR